MRYANILETIGNTPLVELKHLSPRPGVQLFAKLEGINPSGSLKDRIAKKMVEQAEDQQLLGPDSIILEPTSGNTGVALALVANMKGYPFTAVISEKGTQDKRYVMLYQYGNEANALAHYETTGAEILEDLPDVNVFVAGLGTGGTLTGIGRRLKRHDPAIRVVAAEPVQGESIQGLRNLADGFVPPVLDLSVIDARLLVSSHDAWLRTLQLKAREGIFAGPSSGAV